MHHALTGYLLWTSPMPIIDTLHHNGVADAALLPPTFAIPSTASVAGAAPDAVVMDRSGRVVRLAGINGSPVWMSDVDGGKDAQDQVIPVKLHSTQSHTVVVSLVPHQPKLRLFSATQTYSLHVRVLSSASGKTLAAYGVTSSNVEMVSVSSQDNSAGNVLVLGQDGEGSHGVKPQLVWLQTDGSVRSLPLPLPADAGDVQVDSSSVQTVKSKTASRYVALMEVANLSSRGVLVAVTNDGKSETLKVTAPKQELKSIWQFEEDARDAVYSGSTDRKGKAYLNRIFFSRGQHLLNFHVLWIDAHDGEGQVTGFSFQWDHDLNGDVLAAPFEASQVGEYQLVTRAAFVTASSSIRMVQEDRHFWIREEGLSHTTATVLIDLPEGRMAVGAHHQDSGLDAKSLLEGEGYLKRLKRHLLALQYSPEWVAMAIWKAVLEVPALSLDSFGIQGLGTKKAHVEQNVKKPLSTTASRSYGAAPLGGVGAQNVFRGGSQGGIAPKGLPQVNTRKVKSALKDVSAPPPTALAPRLANETVASGLVRDSFGFRKLIVATSNKGKIYAIDSQTGDFLWEKSLVGFGEGEGAERPLVTVKLLALVRSVGGSGVDVGTSIQQQAGEESSHVNTAQLEYGSLLMVVAEVEEVGVTFTRMWEIDPMTGTFPGGDDSQTGLALFPGKTKDAFLLPVEDAASGQIATAVVDRNDKLYIWPTTDSVASRFTNVSASFFYTVEEKMQGGQSILAGYTPSLVDGVLKGKRVWQLPIPSDEQISGITRPNQDVVASQGKVLGSRKTLYKHLNPHALVVTTRDASAQSARALVIDGITGRVLHDAALCQGGLALRNEDGTPSKIHVMFTENWITAVFDVDVGADDALARYKGAHRQTRLVSIELYETQGREDETWKWKGKMSSFARVGAGVHSAAVQVYSQLYILPQSVRGLAASRTKYGITSKALLVANTRGRIMALPRRLLDPRRPMGRKATAQEMEEGLMTYDAYIQESPKWYLGSGKQVPLASDIKTKASLLESLSVVFVQGSLDWWVTKVAPSGTFDLLSGE